ncbi:hypothetical protein GCWU000324_02731 [Kingella oralis ATCC 51147]|uniref:Uncharacterized protein n=1 Tax=Kingella oralis ATCC 51147 TaxID=629741 RepID=C4GM06_9NEIS|nr:hypothetical protein GCWU000324_02731 [Kingella oralis ATCC 51147]
MMRQPENLNSGFRLPYSETNRLVYCQTVFCWRMGFQAASLVE